MILPIVEYGHPALRSKGRRIEKIDSRIGQLAGDMIDTMNDANGVGLAAQQVGLPIQLCVIDVLDAEEPGEMIVDGEAVPLEDYMPLVLINAEVEKIGDPVSATEGCLSFPGMQGKIPRPPEVQVKATTLENEPLEFRATGLLARAVQHEHDHLHGILFIDRMEPDDLKAVTPTVEKLMRRNSMS
ncbi:MAG TPA: peptide deformylase [Chthoniobacterales bacterium]|jgi:peptide deformylase|nr:peptide deformylase [Chthoniobacterales bacterium]